MRFVISPNCDMIDKKSVLVEHPVSCRDLQVDKVERICKYSQERIDSIFPSLHVLGGFKNTNRLIYFYPLKIYRM